MERLQKRVRDYRAGYRQSLDVLVHAKASRPGLLTKTSLMLGLGEEAEEVRQVLRDLRDAGVDVVTFGQYLRPTRRHMTVARFVPPIEFDGWRKEAEEMGFKYVAAGPLVRSSYRAGELFLKGILENKNNSNNNNNTNTNTNNNNTNNNNNIIDDISSAKVAIQSS